MYINNCGNFVTQGFGVMGCGWFDLILISSLDKNTLIKHLTSVMRAPVRSSLAYRGPEPSRQARESVHQTKEKKNRVCKKR